MTMKSSVRTIGSLDPCRERGIEVTLDLVHACPIWHAESVRLATIPSELPARRVFGRFLDIRRRWSFQRVTVSAPLGKNCRIDGEDLQMLWQNMSYLRCRSEVHWKVIGPPPLMIEMDGDPWDKCSEAQAISMFLCQHEIRGD
jgi:hypothetical protein